MNVEHATQSHGTAPARPWVKWSAYLAVALIGVWAALELIPDARRYLPFALLLACPLMHLFHGNAHARKAPQQGDAGARGAGE